MRWALLLLCIAATGCLEGNGLPDTGPVSFADAAASLDAGADLRGDAEVAGPDAAEVTSDAGPDAGSAPVGDTGTRLVTVRVFHTSDEHGWLQPATEGTLVLGGAANLRAWWAKESLDPAKDLVLSSGDGWQGPAISSYFQGESMVELMNLLGYRATAIGNHEFDWGREVMARRFAQASYPALSANLRYVADGKAVDFAQRFVLLEVQGAKVGVIGLTTPSTATATNPKYVSDLSFEDPEATLEAVIPEVRAAGADAVLVLSHLDHSVALGVARKLGVKPEVFFTGHDHRDLQATANGIAVVGSGWALRSYTVTTLQVDTVAHSAKVLSTRLQPVEYSAAKPNPVVPNPPVAAAVDVWQQKLDVALGEVVGYTATGLPLGGWAQANWSTDAWLTAFPDADMAVQNMGGLRQAVPVGPISLATIHGVLPFDNRIVAVRITGEQLVENLKQATAACGVGGGCYPAVAGLRFSGTGQYLTAKRADGTPIEATKTYTVLTNDFLYAGGSGYLFGEQDPNGVELGVNYREPVVAWTRAKASTEQAPLEGFIDAAPRNQ